MWTVYQWITFLFLLCFAGYDIRHRKIKNTALLCFLPWCLMRIPIEASFTGHPVYALGINSFLGFLSGGLVLFVAAMLTNGGIGGGDIKLAALLGILYGPEGTLLLLPLAAIFAMVFGCLKAFFICRRDLYLPFVPFLLSAALFIKVLPL